MTVFAPPLAIDASDDPRLADYRALKEQRLKQDTGKFIAESEGVVLRLLASALPVESILVTETKWRALQNAQLALPPRSPVAVYVVPPTVMDQVAGFHVHRGCLAVGLRPVAPALPRGAQLVLALEDLVDVENVGGVVRNAAAFGADGLLLSPQTVDPYYRKAIRVAMGNTFALPIVRARAWPHDLLELRHQLGAQLVGTVVQAHGALPLSAFSPQGPTILLLGAEGPGLSQAARSACDQLITIPMHAADSLNVATAAAVTLYHLSTMRSSPPATT